MLTIPFPPVFARAVAVHWITKRDRFGSDPEKPLRRKGGHRTSRPARHDADACSKVPGLCCSGLQGSTLLTMSSAAYNGARSRPGGDADEVVHRAHPGELVPGSLYLGRGRESAEVQQDAITAGGQVGIYPS